MVAADTTMKVIQVVWLQRFLTAVVRLEVLLLTIRTKLGVFKKHLNGDETENYLELENC